MLLILATLLIVLYLTVNIGLIVIRNYKAQKFFQTKSPQLPVLPKPNLLWGHALQVLANDKNWKVIKNLHEEYGPTFGFYMCGQPWVTTTDVEVIKKILIDEAREHLDRALLGAPFYEFNHSIFQVNGNKWRQMRRVMAPGLTNHYVRSDDVTSDIESIVVQLADSMERRINASPSGSFVMDAKDMAIRYTSAVTFLLIYKQTNVIDFDSDQDPWTNELDRAARDLNHPIVRLSVLIPFLRPLCQFLARFTTVGRLLNKINKFIIEATEINQSAREEHEKEGQKDLGSAVNFADVKSQGRFKRRLVDTIIDGYHENKISYDHLVGSLLALLVAGGITVADTVSSLMWELAKNPDCQQKLRKSILVEGIDADYVEWSINEAVRLHPAAPLSGGRVLAKDVQVNGMTLAKGTFVTPFMISLHRDPAIWPEPNRYNPDRWRDRANFHPAAFLGFGLGPRNCVGSKLAYQELKQVLAMLLSKYRLEVCDETPDELRFSTPGLINTNNDDPVSMKFVPLTKDCTHL